MSDKTHGILPRFSVDRPVTVVMTLLAIVVLGFIAYSRIKLAMFPEGRDRKSLMVFVGVANATPADVEQQIVRPIEEIVGTIPGVASVWSRSSTGNAFVRVTFQNDVPLKDAYAELRDRMDRVMPEMPDEVDRIHVRSWDENDIPIMEMAVSISGEAEAAMHALEQFVQPALQRIDGVGNVNIHGLRSRQVIIDLRPDRVAAHNIDLAQLLGRLRGQDVNVPGGWVMEGGSKFYVRSLGRYTEIEEIGNLVVDATTGLRLRDIATIDFRPPDEDRIYRVDGRPRIGIEIQRSSDGNIVEVSRAVRRAIGDFAGVPQLAEMRFEIFFDQGEHVQQAIRNLRNSGLWGGLFAAVILFVFLRAPRMTGIITLAIPLSLLMTVIVLYFMGWSLNMVTMMGLLLSVGLVVDNSIVIVENIYRKRQEGVSARRASIEGTGEVGLAVVMATLTTVVVFVPLMLMAGGDDLTFFMLRLGVPVIVSLLASLFIALIFIPLAALKLSRGTKHLDLPPVAWARDRYERVLRLALRQRTAAVLVILLLAGATYHPFSKLQRTDRAGAGEDTVRMFFDMPSGTTLEQADAFMSGIEQTLLGLRAKYDISRLESRFEWSRGRMTMVRSQPANTDWYAVVWRWMREWSGKAEPRMTRTEIEADLRSVLQFPPGYSMRHSWRDSAQQQDSSSSSITLYGEDTDTLVELALEVERRLLAIPEVIEVDTELDRGRDELRIRLDRDQARRLGVEPQMVAANISHTLRGLRLGQFQRPDGREVDIQVQLEDARNVGLDDVRQLTFRNREGQMIPLESVATLEVSRALGDIRRENRQTSLRVTARATQQDARRLFQSIDDAMEGMTMPRGYRWDRGSRWFQMQQTSQAGTFALVMAVSFVFFLMGVLFESFVLPLAVIIAVPFAFLGVSWTLYLTNTPLDMMSTIGVVILVGVVVNNAIVLVDLANRLRLEGQPRVEALVQAARHRFRPILMTTCTTACGLIPMALGDSRLMEMSYAPIGRTMMGGLLTATLMTLVVVPLFYTLVDDLRAFLSRAAASALTTDGAAPAARRQ